MKHRHHSIGTRLPALAPILATPRTANGAVTGVDFASPVYFEGRAITPPPPLTDAITQNDWVDSTTDTTFAVATASSFAPGDVIVIGTAPSTETAAVVGVDLPDSQITVQRGSPAIALSQGLPILIQRPPQQILVVVGGVPIGATLDDDARGATLARPAPGSASAIVCSHRLRDRATGAAIAPYVAGATPAA